MYKQDIASNNLQWLICHKTQPNQIIYIMYMYKEDLALNNLQWLICYETNQSKFSYTFLSIRLLFLLIIIRSGLLVEIR